MKSRVLVIGALPPPAIGPTIAMERFISSPELNHAFDVQFLDISDRRDPHSIGNFDIVNLLLGLQHAAICVWKLLTFRPKVVYLGISQGTWGYLRDLAFVIPSLLFFRRVVIHLRGSEFREFYSSMSGGLRWLTRKVFSRVSRVIVLGKNLRRVFEGIVNAERVVVIPNGIDYQMFRRNEETPSNGKRLLYLASLRKRKGILALLEAFPAILAKHPDATLTIAGAWQSVEDKKTADDLISRHGLATRLEFVGEISGDAKIRAYAEHDIFVFTPVEPEGLPWVVLEAMSSSLPVITSDQGAIVEVVQHGQNGFVINPQPDEIARAVCHLIENPAEARKIGVAARKRIEQEFSEQVYLSRMIKVLQYSASEQEVASATSPVRPAA